MGNRYFKKQGLLKTLKGKAIFMLSLGLFSQVFGQIVYSIYDDILHISIPYPSLGDLGYFLTIPFYLYGSYLLAKALNVKIGFQQIKEYFLIVIIFLILLFFGYFLLLQHYTFNWSNFLKIFLDFAYPFGDIIYVFITAIGFLQLYITKRVFIKNKILLVLLALSMECLSDYVFVLQANAKTWYAGNLNDYMYFISYVLMTVAILQLNSI